ncbi:Carboxylesterase and related proteins [Phaffia rhodozyma]|uniref:Carboxylesterase and related proteins n=1 Tax=Phaffia rhodozyma TaxID=264483 RepID=A0A0F7SNJ6_PHARH|nr:Carboxylesterase and related proteins [Phaffia rhodozyma]
MLFLSGLLFPLILFIQSVSSVAALANSSNTKSVFTSLGWVQGSVSGDVTRYTVKYAKANRWKDSQITTYWDNVASYVWFFRQDGTSLPPTCPQASNVASTSSSSEDCLSLVIYAPPSAKDLPIMLWIHGGSFVTGSASAPGLDGSKFALKNDVIVVVIQYRLGVLGLLPPANASSSPNLAVRDVINSLKYVRSVASSYGGNKNKITIAGQSSGAHMIRALLSSPQAKGLFHSAILQSDPMTYGMSTPTTTSILTNAFYSTLTNSTAQMSAADLVAAQTQFLSYAYTLDNSVPLAESIRPTASSSDATLPMDFFKALQAGSLPSGTLSVPLLLTTVKDEFGSSLGPLNPEPVPSAYYAPELSVVFRESDKSAAILNSLEYPLGTDGDATRTALLDVGTEGLWTCAVQYAASLWKSKGGAVYVGEFEAGSPYDDNQQIPYCTGLVCHEDDIKVVFGTGSSGSNAEVVSRWGSFVRDSTPNGGAYTNWKQFDSPSTILPLGGSTVTRSCPAGFWGSSPVLFDWQMYSA